MIWRELYFYNQWIIILFIGLFFLCIGSFLNVVIYRLPSMLSQEESSSLNLCWPRSFCPHCSTHLKIQHNIPVISYLFLKGHCAFCRQSISVRYPLVELLTASLGILLYLRLNLSLELLFSLLFICMLIPLFFIDLDTFLLPDVLTLTLLWTGLLANLSMLFCPLQEAVLGAITGYLSLWLFTKIFYLITKKVGMGHGDFKLFAALGAWFGVYALCFILITGCLMGVIAGSLYLKWAKKPLSTPIPFGPFLCLAGFMYLLKITGS